MSVLLQQFDRDRVPRLAGPEFRSALLARIDSGARVVTLYGRACADPNSVSLDAVLQPPSGSLELLCAEIDRAHGLHELTTQAPAVCCFEREIHEQTGLRIAGHPWLKPIRHAAGSGAYPYHVVEGKEVHEVAVGPIHAGVIEPGSFRFSCLGELVHHLEIELGYQHRGVEALLRERPATSLAPLVETIAGDSSIAHTWAYCAAIESLAGATVDLKHEAARAALLELERIAMHLATLSGLAADIGALQGAAGFGRLRTLAINATMQLCGSRFGRGALRPGGVRLRSGETAATGLLTVIEQLEVGLRPLAQQLRAAWTVKQRLRNVGTLSPEQARALGVVGVAARASGLNIDARMHLEGGPYDELPIAVCTRPEGDCWARCGVRLDELSTSLAWLRGLLTRFPAWDAPPVPVGDLAPTRLVVAVVEGCRGEVVHCLSTDQHGAITHYKAQDPSLRNWPGLALAMRNNEISDFPICNKSFDLSYCGNDL